MWRDQVNILQDRSSDLSLDRGRDGEQRGRICTRLPIDICPQKNNNNKKLDFVPKHFFANTQHAQCI